MATKKTPSKPSKTAAPPPPKADKPPKAPKEAKPKIERVTANGVTRPKDGSLTGKVWDIADKITAGKPKGEHASRTEVMADAEKAGINEATVATQYQRWRTFFGVPKAGPKVKEPKAPKPPKAPAAPKPPKGKKA